MPAIGTVSRRCDEGLKGKSKIIWLACPGCQKERWVMFSLYKQRNGKPICQGCIGRKAIASGRLKNAKHKPDCTCQRCTISQGKLTGSRNPSWSGGRPLTQDGYRYILVYPDNPHSDMSDINNYILEHRYVMAKHLGRNLEPWEKVHHINRNKTDNRIENLELWVHNHPPGIRVIDLLRNYAPMYGCNCEFNEETNE